MREDYETYTTGLPLILTTFNCKKCNNKKEKYIGRSFNTYEYNDILSWCYQCKKLTEHEI